MKSALDRANRAIALADQRRREAQAIAEVADSLGHPYALHAFRTLERVADALHVGINELDTIGDIRPISIWAAP